MAQMLMTAASHLAQQAPAFLAATAADYALNMAFSRTQHGARLADFQIQTSSEGAPMSRVWGRARLAGQVIWASRFREEERKTRPGGKSGPSRIDYAYSVSFAVGLCEGEIAGIGRIWANGAPLDLEGYVWRLHRGTPDQMPDSTIAAIEGDDTPGFRDTAYLVFEDMPLETFGNRIPNLSVEVFRSSSAARLERLVRGVNLIPGSGEFAYQTETVMHELGPGSERAENRNSGRGVPDLIASLDDLERDLPACLSVQLVICWFGDDLRCGHCRIRPGVETRHKPTRPAQWRVAGLDRGQAVLVSQADGRPVYGGSPDDASVIAAIRELKSRGHRVTLYPFILMDIPAGNDLPDPGGAAGQPANPWRGRIRSSSGAGDPSVDTQISDFFGTAGAGDFSQSGEQVVYSGVEDWGLRRFILHCAALGRAAGGVDGFLIGSELVGLTTSRNSSDNFPAVGQLCDLALEARTMLGPDCRLSYAADWTEFSGWQDGQGEKIFHLDPLWSHDAIDAVAIDWYVPLSDWRDGSDHLDAGDAASAHDPDYLASRVAGGEGHDWFYPDETARQAQDRHPISDSVHDEAWIWRCKDLLSWWSHAHHDRPGGVRASAPTGWQPRSKPIWLTEVGCPAVDKGANQPNVFIDPKSSESRPPWFSSGRRDDLVQRRYLEAVLAHWDNPGANPVSPLYGGPMIEADWTHIWAWDGRPWPDFPARNHVWSDGANWRSGHWLNGRAGQVLLADIVTELAGEAGLTGIDVTGLPHILSGYLVSGGQSARSALEPLVELFDLLVVESASAVRISAADGGLPVRSSLIGDLIADPVAVSRLAAADRSGDLRLSFFDDTADYNPGEVRARQSGDADRGAVLAVPVLADPGLAEDWIAAKLERLESRDTGWSVFLPPSMLACEPGDVLTLDGRDVRITAGRGDAAREVECEGAIKGDGVIAGSQSGPSTGAGLPPARALVRLLDIPSLPDDGPDRGGPLVLAFADPWHGPRTIVTRAGSGNWAVRRTLVRPGGLGELTLDLPAGPVGRWDVASICEVRLFDGALETRTTLDVLNGANRIAIAGQDSEWEILQFRDAELVGSQTYRLSGLLRGQSGSRVMASLAGSDVALLDGRQAVLALAEHEANVPLDIRALARDEAFPSGTDPQAGFTARQRHLRPLSPVHLRLVRLGGHWRLGWTRRSRIGGDGWAGLDIPLGEDRELYRVRLWRSGEHELLLETQTTTAWLDLDAAHLSGAGSGLPEAIEVEIAQLSDRLGAGEPLCAWLVL